MLLAVVATRREIASRRPNPRESGNRHCYRAADFQFLLCRHAGHCAKLAQAYSDDSMNESNHEFL